MAHTRLIAFVLLSIAGVFLLLRKPTPALEKSISLPPSTQRNQAHFSLAREPGRPFSSRTVVVGDIHGDLPHFTRILRFVGLIDLRGKWIGQENESLLQTGDVVDRGTDLIALLMMMERLRVESNGRVRTLLGNHEYMNLLGDWRYVTKEDIATFGGEERRRHAMSAEGWIGKAWGGSNYSVTARIDYAKDFLSSVDSPSTIEAADPSSPFSHAAASFVHGGILPTYPPVSSSSPVDAINRIGRSFISSVLSPKLPHGGTDQQHQEFWGRDGPMWSRFYALEEDESTLCKTAEQACEKLGVRRMFMGHTPHFEGIVTRCGGRIVLIDTGISSAYGGVLSAVEILYSLKPSQDGEWFEEEVVNALYQDKNVELVRENRTISLPHHY